MNTENNLPPQASKPAGENGIGIAGFVCAVCAVLLGQSFGAMGLWLLGLIFSSIGLSRRPRGFAIAGFVISIAGIVFLGILLALGFTLALLF